MLYQTMWFMIHPSSASFWRETRLLEWPSHLPSLRLSLSTTYLTWRSVSVLSGNCIQLYVLYIVHCIIWYNIGSSRGLGVRAFALWTRSSHLNKSLARSNKNPFYQGFLTGIATINLRELLYDITCVWTILYMI